MLWIPKEDPRCNSSKGGEGTNISTDVLHNSYYYYKDDWHKRLAIYRLIRLLQVDKCKSDKWLSTPIESHHISVDIQFNFPFKELGVPSEFLKWYAEDQWFKASHYNSEILETVSVLCYRYDDFLQNHMNVNGNGGRSVNFKPEWTKKYVTCYLDKKGKVYLIE
jgi:hypothetical protein